MLVVLSAGLFHALIDRDSHGRMTFCGWSTSNTRGDLDSRVARLLGACVISTPSLYHRPGDSAFAVVG
jgi:hypothetical protein